MSEENRAVVERYFEAVNSGNLDIIDEVIAPDYVGHEPGEETHGPEGVKQFVGTFRNAFPDLSLTIEDQIAEGGKVVSRYTGLGTHQGELTGIAPTGRQVEVPAMNICRLESGKIVEEWELYDTMGLMQQIGVMEQPSE
jgi:steroid delta-isomerase-like uncharacterized protein